MIPAEEQVYPDYKLLKSGLKDRPKEFENYLKVGLETEWFTFDERANGLKNFTLVETFTLVEGWNRFSWRWPVGN